MSNNGKPTALQTDNEVTTSMFESFLTPEEDKVDEAVIEEVAEEEVIEDDSEYVEEIDQQIADELKRNNGGYRPANYDSEIKRIFNERYGNQIKSEYEDLMALPDDPKKLNNVGRRTVPPGTPLGEKTIQMYFELANGDPIKATELAEEDGYDVPK